VDLSQQQSEEAFVYAQSVRHALSNNANAPETFYANAQLSLRDFYSPLQEWSEVDERMKIDWEYCDPATENAFAFPKPDSDRLLPNASNIAA
jgi:hypothetical protein